MPKSLRTAAIVLLSIGLLALFLRGAHLDVVWAEITPRERVADRVVGRRHGADDGVAGAAMAVPARTNWPRPVWTGVSHNHDRVCCKCGAPRPGRRGDPPLPACPAGRAQRDGNLRHHHHRTAARCRDVRHVARVVCVVLRSGDGQRGQPAVLARRSGWRFRRCVSR